MSDAPGLVPSRRIVQGTFPSLPASVPQARAMLGCLEDNVSPATAAALRLLVSELVTNSVRYAPAGDVTVKLVVSDRLIRLEVADPGSGGVERRDPTPQDERGRGLQLVDAIAARWGCDQLPETLVWAELPVC